MALAFDVAKVTASRKRGVISGCCLVLGGSSLQNQMEKCIRYRERGEHLRPRLHTNMYFLQSILNPELVPEDAPSHESNAIILFANNVEILLTRLDYVKGCLLRNKYWLCSVRPCCSVANANVKKEKEKGPSCAASLTINNPLI